MTDYVDPPDPDLDDVPRRELGEINEMYPVVADALIDWISTWAGPSLSDHCIGTFLNYLAAEGYRVTAIDPGPCLHELLGPPKE